jgi:hypothetical protein
MTLARSITRNTVGKHPVAAMGCFFSLFLLVGAVLFFFIFIRPVQQIVAAGSWDEAQCVILSSSVASHRGSKGGTTYSIEVEYEYWVDDRRYTSDRYSFAVGSTSGYEGKRKVVEDLPAGKRTVCYVNPSDPADAVLERGMTAQIWLGLLPLIFVAVASIALGDSFDVEWETAGNLGRIRTYRIVLEGREEATYTQGKSSKTDREAFETRVLSEGASGEFLRRGRTRVELPADTMHSWKSSNNRVAWSIRLQAECPNWPDLDEKFSIEVLPRRSAAKWGSA